MKKYLKSDMVRVFCSYKTYLAPICIMIAMNMATDGRRNDYNSMVVLFQRVIISRYMLVTLVISAAVYSCCLVDDLETGYLRYNVIRGNLNGYVISKIVVAFVTSVWAIFIGVLLFVSFNSLSMPLTEKGCFDQTYVQYDFLYNEKYIVLWFGVWGLRFGILAGILSISAMMASLFVTNKMFALAIPALLYQLLLELSVELDKINITIFDLAWFKIEWPINDVFSRIRGILFTVICVLVMSDIILYKVKRRV